jgi:stearoyl-CoA desaturase (delta-9 desaturase)
MHHAYTDTEHDPHSPAYDKNIFRMMMRTSITYRNIRIGKIKIENRFTKNVPRWDWLDWWGNTRASRIIWSGIYAWFYISFAPYKWMYLMIPAHIVMGPIHGVIINWFAHKYGSVSFETGNSSKNLFKVDLIMMREAYHNNHHKFSSRPNFAVKKGEFDPTYPLILLFKKLRIINVPNYKS